MNWPELEMCLEAGFWAWLEKQEQHLDQEHLQVQDLRQPEAEQYWAALLVEQH